MSLFSGAFKDDQTSLFTHPPPNEKKKEKGRKKKTTTTPSLIILETQTTGRFSLSVWVKMVPPRRGSLKFWMSEDP